MAQHPSSFFSYRSPLGPIILAANKAGLTHAIFEAQAHLAFEDAKFKASAITNQAATELLEYLAGKRRIFDVPLAPEGSDFQLAVWSELQRIPYGETRTSMQVAKALHNEELYRSVGVALRKNPLCLFIPDHRVVDTQGKTLGTGETAHHRAMLLAFEQTQLHKH